MLHYSVVRRASQSIRANATRPAIAYTLRGVARRLLLLITDLQIGGTPTVVRELAVRLRDAGMAETSVACLAPWGPVADQIAAANVPVTALGARGAADFRVLPRFVSLLRRGRVDVVLSFLVHANAVAAAAAVVCARGGVRCFQSIQTTQPAPRWHWRVQRVASRAAERVLVPSPSVADVARRWAGVPEEKLVVIPNAIDPADFGEVTPRKGGGPASIGFVGRLDPIKRLPDLIEAVGLLPPPVGLHVFGEGPERARLVEAVATRGLGRRVTFHGAVARPQEALRRIDLLVLPSAAEGFGLVLIEAMAAGVPVVATDVPGIRDVVRHGQTGLLVPPASPPALAEAIRAVLERPDLRDELVRRARADVTERFAWPAVLPRYAAALRLGPTA